MSKIYSLSDLNFIKPATLRAWFQGGSPHGNGKFAVVDVRDVDYAGGHIKGCFHYPANNFIETLPELQQRLFDNKIDDVVFHCMLSQARGPSCTLKFLRSLNDADGNSDYFDKLNVYVLQGGFSRWLQNYADDENLTEGYCKDMWE